MRGVDPEELALCVTGPHSDLTVWRHRNKKNGPYWTSYPTSHWCWFDKTVYGDIPPNQGNLKPELFRMLSRRHRVGACAKYLTETMARNDRIRAERRLKALQHDPDSYVEIEKPHEIEEWNDALVEASARTADLELSVTLDGETVQDLRRIGAAYWFEYRCWESHESEDAQLWYRSHQQVTVLGFADCDPPAYHTMEGRGYWGCCLGYRIRFADGFEAQATEDELLLSKDEFINADPPNPAKA